MLSKQERQKLHDIETRLYDEEPDFVTLFDQLGQKRSVARKSWLRPVLLALLGVLLLGVASVSFVAGPLVGTVVVGATAGLIALGFLVRHAARRKK